MPARRLARSMYALTLVLLVVDGSCGLDGAQSPFDPGTVPGSYFAQIALLEVACPSSAPLLVGEEAPIHLALDGQTMTIEGFPARLVGTLAPDGHFVVSGLHPSPLGEVAASLEGDFLRPRDGRGFVARLVQQAPGCRQVYRVRAF